jgi:hypothetical protein
MSTGPAGTLRTTRTLVGERLIPVMEGNLAPAPVASAATRRLTNFRAVATRYDKRAYVFHGTVTVAAIRLRPRP